MSNPITTEISVRRWQASDFEDAVTLNREAESGLGIPPETGDWATDMVGIEETFLDGGGEFLVGHREEKLVVMGGFKRLDLTTVEVKRMRVTPSLHGRGVGYWFLDLLEEKMQEIGVTGVTVSTLSAQPGALRLYKGAGYTEIGRKPEPGLPNGIVGVYFTKTLTKVTP
jgi:GNAT superfamily N-acetyltransferase